MNQDRATRPQLLLAFIGVWFLIAGLFALLAWPELPKSKFGWFLLFVVGPPVYIAADWFFEWLLSQKHGNRISSKSFSWIRVAIAFAVAVVFVGLSLFIFSAAFEQ
ncbi:hypothetical protein [Sulfurifustis variabilis]|uniref:hypothetical protein n=1 Tax=Sulfurifustis variabilis TaxID=1675686 RepID=UPI0011E4CDC9|nr:hypothetical protein [Sulfurifustis variabilis]